MWQFLTPCQSNLTKWRNPSKLCSSSRKDRHTHYIQLRNDRPAKSPSTKSSNSFPSPLYVLYRQNLSNPLLPFFRPTLIIPYPASMYQPHAIGSRLPSSSLLPLEVWRSRNASLYRWTRREIATWEVSEIICRRRSLQIPFLASPPPSLPPITLVASWPFNTIYCYCCRICDSWCTPWLVVVC